MSCKIKPIATRIENKLLSVSHVYAAEEGLFRMRMNNYSLIVMDVALSEQSGREVIAAMRDLQPMPILILSESASTQERVAAFNHGADDFLAKPFKQLRRKLGVPELAKKDACKLEHYISSETLATVTAICKNSV